MGRATRSSATLEEVAERAGVSRATASRVLRGQSNVSASARDAVNRAAEEIQYTPNRVARALATGRSESIAFVVSETEERMFTEPFFLGMLRSATESVVACHYQLVFTVTSTDAERERFIDYAASGHVDGVLLLSVHGDDDLQEQLEALGVATVLSGRPPRPAEGLYYVDADNRTGGRLATQHMIDTGRTVIAAVTGPLDMCAGEDRLAGYRDALLATGRGVDESLIEVGGFSAAEGYAAAERLLDRRPDVDAIVAPSDLAAIGVIRALTQRGRVVGSDVAVSGFDDFRDAAEHHPPLTTVRQPIADLGHTMTQVLLDRLAGNNPSEYGVVLPVELVVRASA